uniref:Uncharacterized protein n=1 Tax=Chrysotila carterae TaxID=13221 RepID=A0A7S4B0M3_CHRCT|eukprot:911625-Pleurochrysis_carterae.AAC.5
MAQMLAGALQGKVLLVTGAAQGLGREIALMAASLGAEAISICDKNVDLGRMTALAIEEAGSRALFVECDVAEPEQIEKVVRRTKDAFMRIDGLVNCVGDTSRATLDETDVALWDRLHAVNLRSHFLFTKDVSRVMRDQPFSTGHPRGSIVNIASVQSHAGLTECMAYAVAKAGLVCLTKNNAAELGKHAIKVNAINVGWCVTDQENVLQTAKAGPDWVTAADKSCPLGRILRMADVARLVVFLLSDGAHVTGSVMDWHPEFINGNLGGVIGHAERVPQPSAE